MKRGNKIKERVTKEEIYDEIKRLYKKNGFINRKMFDEEKQLDINISSYLHKYGGLKNICKELDIPYTQASRPRPDEVKEDFLNVYKTYGHINIEFYLEKGKFSKQAIKTAFGGVNQLMKLLDIPLNMSRMEDKETVKNDILKFYEKYKSSSSPLYREKGSFSQSVIERIWGSWENMTVELGLDYVGKTFGQEYMLEEIKKIYAKYGFINRTLIDDECEFTYQALRHHYKNKKEISQAIGVKNAFCDSKSAKAKVIEQILIDRYGKENVKVEKAWDWLRNAETNNNMYVDFYIEPINTVIEYDGEQHFKYIEYFHRTEENYFKQRQRDDLKEKLLEEHGIRLIRISHKEKISPSFIARKIDEK